MSKFDTILAATDFSERSARAEGRAAMLCAEHKCERMELLTVKEGSLPETLAKVMGSTIQSAQALMTERAIDELEALTSELKKKPGIRIEPMVLFGQPAPEIVSRADALPADLVVVGAHGGTFFSDLFLGNTADKLVHLFRRPLLIVKREPLGPYRQVLVPIDFSEDSKQAVILALDIAPEAAFTLLHASEVSFEPQMQYANVSQDVINAYRNDAQEQARMEMNRFIADLGADDRIVNRIIAVGSPGAVIREHAKAVQPDLIVMGKHGRSRFEELIVGSAVRDTLGQTDSDVLVVSAAPESIA